jgi:hypothetical protein
MPIVIAVVLIIILAALILKSVLPPKTIASKIANDILAVAPMVGGVMGIPGLGGLPGSTPSAVQLTPAQIEAARQATLAAQTKAAADAAAPAPRSPFLTLAVLGAAVFLVLLLLIPAKKK